ncbi:MAG: PQQ-dependent sugar dehydrogenase [Caulobacteraceae bacterium]|nr:PQQ-dependent sugar dehydrogenase [Caulobacteraceae bacterium]
MRNAWGLAAAAFVLLVACGRAASQGAEAAQGQTLETRPANTRYAPAFPGQTRAPALPSSSYLVEVVAAGLEKPWAVEPLADGRFLVTEKAGRMRLVSADGALSPPVAGLPAVDPRGQGGLLDVALSPTFAADGLIYWSYAEPREGGNGTTVARGRLVETPGAAPRVEDVRVIFRVTPTYDGNKHYGSRLVFAPDGKLFITDGERSDLATRPQAQQLGSHLGKVMRINPDGSTPADNPFVHTPGALPEIWALGLRNVQGAAIRPGTNQLYTVEHGPRGGDELNRPEAGRNYGWGVISYGLEYSGAPVGQGITAREGMEQPLYYWDPVIAPSGMQFYDGAAFPAWRGDLFIGGMKDRLLVRLKLDGDRVIGEEHLLSDRGKRIRDVRQGPDGYLYVVTDETAGELLRIRPKPGRS